MRPLIFFLWTENGQWQSRAGRLTKVIALNLYETAAVHWYDRMLCSRVSSPGTFKASSLYGADWRSADRLTQTFDVRMVSLWDTVSNQQIWGEHNKQPSSSSSWLKCRKQNKSLFDKQRSKNGGLGGSTNKNNQLRCSLEARHKQ